MSVRTSQGECELCNLAKRQYGRVTERGKLTNPTQVEPVQLKQSLGYKALEAVEGLMIPSFGDIADGLGVFSSGWSPSFRDPHMILKLENLVEYSVVAFTCVASFGFEATGL